MENTIMSFEESQKLKWNENQERQLTSEGYVEVSYRITDPKISKADASAENEETHFLSNLQAAIDEADYTVTPYGTLENDFWILDGSKRTIPSDGNYEYSGFLSNSLCGKDRSFSNPLCISIEFEKTVPKLPGLTITWGIIDGEYPTDFEALVYSNGEEVSKKRVENNSDVVSILESSESEVNAAKLKLEEFNKIEIRIHKWSKGLRRARIGKIFLGIIKSYTKSELLSFSASQSIDPLSATLPKYDISFSLYNDSKNGEFNPLNDDGIAKYMEEWQEIRARYGFLADSGEVIWTSGGVYFLSDWSAPQNGWTATLKARDLLELLSAEYKKGRFPNEGETITLYGLAEEVLKEANLPKYRNGDVRWTLSEKLKKFTTTSPLPICSMAECLQLIANAACCTIYFDRNGKMHIEPMDNWQQNDKYEVTNDNSYSKTEISTAKPIKQIDVNVYSYVAEAGEKKIYEETRNIIKGVNEIDIVFSDVISDITNIIIDNEYDEETKTNVNHRPIKVDEDKTKKYAKSCKLVLNSEIDGKCDVIISGKVLKQNKTVKSVLNENVPVSSDTHTLDNELITSEEHAKVVLDWLEKNLNCRKNLSVDLRVDPTLNAGDVVNINNNIKYKMRVTSSSFSFTGAFKGKIEGVVI